MLREVLQYCTTRVTTNDAMRCHRYPVVYLLGFSCFALENTLAALSDTKPKDGPVVQRRGRCGFLMIVKGLASVALMVPA